MGVKQFFLWPQSKLANIRCLIPSGINSADVERVFADLYPKTYPVLFSSGRAGLTAVLELLDLRRADRVYFPSYSSHCVLEAIAHLAAPTPVLEGCTAALVYNQWGFFHKIDSGNGIAVIDDSVDTLFIPGTPLVVTGRRFTLLSLPKTLGTLCGGIVACHTAEDADALRHIRDKRGRSVIQVAMRALSKRCTYISTLWNGSESLQGGLPYFAINQIYDATRHIPELCKQRLEIISRLSKLAHENALHTGRIPSNLPLKTQNLAVDCITSGYRHFNAACEVPQEKWEKVLPIPVHKDIDEGIAAEMLAKIGPEPDWAFNSSLI